MCDILLYGAGGLGKEIYFLSKQLKKEINIKGFIDDFTNRSEYCGLPVFNKFPFTSNFFLAIANPKVKRLIADGFADKHLSENIIHQSIQWEAFNSLGNGNAIFEGVVLSGDVNVGNYVLIHMNATIGHDSMIGDFCSILPGVHLSGNVKIGECTLLGSGSVLLPGISIGKNCIIGAGSVITKDIPDNAVVIGVPGKIKRFI